MLEAERAGARALVVYLGSFERNSEPWKILRAIQADEAHNCALIGKLIEKSGTPYSHATGEFYDKAVAVKNPRAQIAFLVRGLKWAVKKFEAALPQLDPEARDLFIRMRDSHLRSIAACERVLKTMPA
jgi:nitronate monooxygenase